MWKLQNLEPILNYNTGARINVDAQDRYNHKPYLDIIRGKTYSDEPRNWDIRIVKSPTPDSPYRLLFEVNDGGVIQKNDTFLFDAPQSGYVSALTFFEDTDGSRSSEEFSGYIKMRRGSAYAAIRGTVLHYGNGQSYRFEMSELRANLNGSRNLQYDGSNRIVRTR